MRHVIKDFEFSHSSKPINVCPDKMTAREERKIMPFTENLPTFLEM